MRRMLSVPVQDRRAAVSVIRTQERARDAVVAGLIGVICSRSESVDTSLTSVQHFGSDLCVTNTRRVVTIERKGGDRTMDDHGRGHGPRPEGVGAPDAESRPRDPLPYEGVWRFTAPAVDASVPQARHAVRDLLARQGVPASDDLVQGLLLIVSELVTNVGAARGAALAELAVEVAVGAEWVRVSVEDNHPYRPDRPGGRPRRRPAAAACSWCRDHQGGGRGRATSSTPRPAAR